MHIRRPQDIGALVKTTRLVLGLSQQELAHRLGVSRLWVNELEGGKATARLDLVLRALNELEIALTAAPGTSSEASGDLPPGTPLHDIDEIADTGLDRDRHGGKAGKRPRR